MAENPLSPTEDELRRVLYVIKLDPSRKFGSLEEQILCLALAFRDRGSLLLPTFVTDVPAERAVGFPQAGVEVACLDIEQFRLQGLRDLLRLIRRHKIEVVHWGMTPPLSYYVLALSLLAPRVRHFFTDHNSRLLPLPPPPRQPVRALKRLLLGRFSRVLCVSDYVRECQDAQGVWSNNVTCLHFINTDRFRPDERERVEVRKRLLGQDHNRAFVALAVGQLIPEKGLDVLLRAMKHLPDDVVAWIAGEGAEGPALEALARELGVTNRVRFLGSQAQVQPFMQAADCLVCPSRWAEAAGLVNLEAQACGLPVVASRIGGIPEYVRDGQTGLLFTPLDHAALAEQMQKLRGAPALRRAMGEAARARAVECYSVPARLDEYLDHYRDTPSRAAANRPPPTTPLQPLSSGEPIS